MLPKIEFGHFYKFIASLGLVIMGVSVALPWLLFQQLAPLTIKEEELKQYTEMAQQTIHSRQYNLEWWSENHVGISILTFLAGVAVTIHGLQGWKERQRVTDDKEKEELRSMIAAAPASDAEVSNRLESEVEAAIAETSEPDKAGTTEPTAGETPPQSDSPASKTKTTMDSASEPPSTEARRLEARLKIEEYEGRLGEILTATLGPTHEVTRNARLSIALGSSSSAIHDVVAVPRDKRLPAYVFDVKVSARLFPGRITESAVRMAADIAALPMEERERVFGCVVFIVDGKDKLYYTTPFRAKQEIDKVTKVLKQPVGIVLLTESEFNSLPYEDLSFRVLEGLTQSDNWKNG